MTAGMLGAISAAAVMLAVAFYLRKRGRDRKARRGAFLDAVAPLFVDPVWALTPTGFPRLSGRKDGRLFDLQVVPDTLTYRKLPTLWLLVTLPEPLPITATLDIVMRPMGVETFSHFNDLAVQLTIPHGFPPDCAIRCDHADGLPDFDLVARHLAGLDKDQLKEVLISPKGVRIVWLAEEADRTRYLLFRDAEMGQNPLALARLKPLLAALRALHDDLNQGPP